MKIAASVRLCLPAFLFVFGLSLEALGADRVKVRRVKGNNAIVESTVPLEEGQTYQLVPDSITDNVDYSANMVKPRTNSLTLGAHFNFLKSSTVETTDFSLQTRYGWNFFTFEVGALLEASVQDSGGGATNTVLAGGYFDYNLVPNRDPKKLLYGPFVLLAFGSTSYPSSTAGGSTTRLEGNLGGFVSYFIGASTTALRAEGFVNYRQINTSATQNTLTGFGARGLLVFYF